MKKILLVSAAVALCSGAAQAADLFAGEYGNTLSITAADGSKSSVFINQDMTWEQHGANGAVVKGTYSWKDATTACFTVVTPAPKSPDQATACYGNQAAHVVGDSWTMATPDGKSSAMTITAGR